MAGKHDEQEHAINNVNAIIERFGGLRPMSKKTGVAVTTIQGWKARDALPIARKALILEAAQTHGIDVSDLFPGMTPPPAEGQPVIQHAVHHIEAVSVQESSFALQTTPAPILDVSPVLLQDQTPKKKFHHTIWFNLALLCVGGGATMLLLWPQHVDNQAEIVPPPVAEKTLLESVLPEETRDEIDRNLGAAIEKAQEISSDVLGDNGATLQERAVKLQGHLSGLITSPELGHMMERFESWSTQAIGQSQLANATAELASLMQNLKTNADPLMQGPFMPFEMRLHMARAQNPALGAAFDGVPAADLKAAALLLGVTQFRTSLNRDNAPFLTDLQVLKGLVGSDDPELTQALDRLAPQAEEGILTPSGLANEFKTLAGEAALASLQGQDVPITEKIKARLHDILKIERNGVPLTGTKTQSVLARTEHLLNAGDIEGAMRAAQNLEGPAAQVVAPWITKAQATNMAQKVKRELERAVRVSQKGQITAY